MTKPSIPQGTRDFGPEVVRKRNYIFNTIRNVFELYGFQPLETPAMENLETLMGKYGEEGDKLIFKILNNGLDNPSKEKQIKEDFEKVLQGKNIKGITERALKYDLTIPFARFVAMNHGQLIFPFKRYQIQPVWRADRPQKGRYREFYQCDADIVGSTSLLNEAELINIYHDVFTRLEINNYELIINNRKILAGLAKLSGENNSMLDIANAIDKKDKIGIDGVKLELSKKGFTQDQINIINRILVLSEHFISNDLILLELKKLFNQIDIGIEGIKELEFVINHINNTPPHYKTVIEPSLARGLNYYTGIIFEARAKDVQIGSIGGGGRYDDLTGLFGVPNIPGVGISFGVDRIYDVMEELNLFPADVYIGTQVLFFNLGEKESKVAFDLAQQLRKKNIRCELYHEYAKFDKQFKYAEKKNIPYIVIIGSNELQNKTCTIKNLKSGEQITISENELINYKF